jgi:hypothetical protein
LPKKLAAPIAPDAQFVSLTVLRNAISAALISMDASLSHTFDMLAKV